MAKITVETATLADAVQKAARVAPNKGAAFDKAAGVLFEIDPIRSSTHIYVKATDLEVTYLQRVPVILVEGDDDLWRIPSALIAGVISNLPLGIGSEATLEKTAPHEVTIKCGRKKIKVRMFDPDSFPQIKPFDPAGMAKVDGFPRRLSQAEWATDPESAILAGVHIDGTRLVACDRSRLVIVPCEMPVDAPVTVTLRAIAPVIRNAGSVEVRVQGDRLQIMPDEDTQITSLCLAAVYPKVDGIMRDNFDGEVSCDREVWLDALTRMLVLVKGDRYPRVHVTLSKDSMMLFLSDDSTGEMTDELDVEGGPPAGEEFEIEFSPNTLTSALGAATRQMVTFKYGGRGRSESFKPNMLPIHFYDEGGFDSWLMPLAPDK